MRTPLALLAAALCAVALVAPPARTADDTDRALAPAPGPRSEPSVAVSPRDPRVVLVAAMEFKSFFQTGYGQIGLPSVVLWRSSDGGTSYARVGAVPMPPGTRYTGDPSVAFDGAGRAYAAYLGSSDTTDGGLFMVRSDDGGRTWPATATRVARKIIGPDGCIAHDKPYLATGPRNAVYVAWHTNAYHDAACTEAAPYEVWFARSGDAGRTWSRPLVLADEGDPVGATPAVAPDGTVHVAYVRRGTSCDGTDPVEIRVATSRDGGRSFAHARAFGQCFAGIPGRTDAGLWTQHSHPTIAVDPRTGAVAVASSGATATGQPVTVAVSRDRGRTWQRGGSVAGPADVQAMPVLSWGRTLAVQYLLGRPGGVYDAVLRSSDDGGRTWSAARTLTSLPSEGNLRPFHVDTWSIGHYLGLAVGPDGVAHAAWPDVRPQAPPSQVNVWVRSVRL